MRRANNSCSRFWMEKTAFGRFGGIYCSNVKNLAEKHVETLNGCIVYQMCLCSYIIGFTAQNGNFVKHACSQICHFLARFSEARSEGTSEKFDHFAGRVFRKCTKYEMFPSRIRGWRNWISQPPRSRVWVSLGSLFVSSSDKGRFVRGPVNTAIYAIDRTSSCGDRTSQGIAPVGRSGHFFKPGST